MAKKAEPKKMRPALTPEARENQMISLAIDLAEQKLLDGTANSQLITHYLKLATDKYRRENEKLKNENNLLQAKTDAIQSAQRTDEIYEKVLEAMKKYSGVGDEDYL